MINENFDIWDLRESLGDGTETFQERIEMYGNLRNLHISGFPEDMGELDGAKGTLKYRIELDVNRSGLEGILFRITEIDLILNVIREEDGDPEEVIFKMDEEALRELPEKNMRIEVGKFPLYLDSIDITFNKKDLNLPTFEISFGKFS